MELFIPSVEQNDIVYMSKEKQIIYSVENPVRYTVFCEKCLAP